MPQAASERAAKIGREPMPVAEVVDEQRRRMVHLDDCEIGPTTGLESASACKAKPLGGISGSECCHCLQWQPAAAVSLLEQEPKRGLAAGDAPPNLKEVGRVLH